MALFFTDFLNESEDDFIYPEVRQLTLGESAYYSLRLYCRIPKSLWSVSSEHGVKPENLKDFYDNKKYSGKGIYCTFEKPEMTSDEVCLEVFGRFPGTHIIPDESWSLDTQYGTPKAVLLRKPIVIMKDIPKEYIHNSI